MTIPAKLKLTAWDPTLEGDGERLSLVLKAFKPNKKSNAASWRGALVLDLDRHFIKRLAGEIADMQKRDRARLARERERLDLEVAPLRSPQPTEAT